MKRFLSIMLTVMLVMSSFVMVSGEVYLDPVITVEPGENGASYEFGETFDGYYNVSVKVNIPEGVTEATMIAKNGAEGEAVATLELPTASTNRNWVEYTLRVNGAAFDRVAFTAKGERIYVSYFSVDRVYAKNLLFEENFEFDKVGEDLPYVAYLKPNSANGATQLVTGTADKKTSFTIAENIGDKASKVGNLYNPYHSSSDVRRYNDAGEFLGDGEGDMYKTDATNNNSTANEHYVIDVPAAKDATHIVAEFDVYNAANSIHYNTGAALDTLHFSVGQSTSTHNQMSEMAKIEMNGTNFRLTGKKYDGTDGSSDWQAHGVEPKTWNKVIYEIKRETYVDTADSKTKWKITSKITYNEKTITNETYRAAANDFGRIFICAPYQNGGRYYIDNLKLYNISEMDDAYISRYSENFDSYELGTDMTTQGYGTRNYANVEFKSTFTVDSTYDAETNPNGKGISGNSSKYGRLFNPRYGSSDVGDYRYNDDETTVATDRVPDRDEDGKLIGNNAKESFYKAIPGMENGWGADEEGETKKTRIKFKYYLPETTMRYDTDNYNWLAVGMGRGDTYYSSDVAKINNIVPHTSSIAIPQRINNSTSGVSSVKANYEVYSTNSTASNAAKTTIDISKKWIPVTIDIVSEYKSTRSDGKALYAHTIKASSLYAESGEAYINNDGGDLNNLLFGVDYAHGGHAYIDDIEILTNVLSDEDYANVETITENVYLIRAVTQNPAGEFRIEKYGTFSSDAQEIRISKGHSYTENINFVLALYDKDDVLIDASLNELNVGTINPFATKSFTLTDLVEVPETLDGHTYRAFVFSTDEGLKPLADMINGDVTVATSEAE